MSKIVKYTNEHIDRVEELMNDFKMSKKNALKLAGFKHPETFTRALYRLGRYQKTTFPFINKNNVTEPV